ncbi:MAG: CHAT domain-containing protein, partial [Deltaproteobacteria bacterium]
MRPASRSIVGPLRGLAPRRNGRERVLVILERAHDLGHALACAGDAPEVEAIAPFRGKRRLRGGKLFFGSFAFFQTSRPGTRMGWAGGTHAQRQAASTRVAFRLALHRDHGVRAERPDRADHFRRSYPTASDFAADRDDSDPATAAASDSDRAAATLAIDERVQGDAGTGGGTGWFVAMSRHTILFLAANPHATDSLRLDEECAAIERELRLSPHRDDFQFVSRWSVSIDDLIRHLNELNPTVIHFSGHGGRQDGLLLQNEHGQQPVSMRALAMILDAAAKDVRLVVLNACYTNLQAEALRARVDCVVGMAGAIGDDAARAFAMRFYGALARATSPKR